MKRFHFFLILILPFVFFSCEKQYESKKVTYQITKSSSGFVVNYKNEIGELISKTIATGSAEDVWTYTFERTERSIVFLSARYYDINSAIQLRILIDDKVYKQASSKNDTSMYVTISGTVPE